MITQTMGKSPLPLGKMDQLLCDTPRDSDSKPRRVSPPRKKVLNNSNSRRGSLTQKQSFVSTYGWKINDKSSQPPERKSYQQATTVNHQAL